MKIIKFVTTQVKINKRKIMLKEKIIIKILLQSQPNTTSSKGSIGGKLYRKICTVLVNT